MKSIFPKFSLDRSFIRWEDYLQALTPKARSDLLS